MLKATEGRRVSATISLDPDLDRRLIELTVAQRMSRSEVVRNLLRRALAAERRKVERKEKP